MQDKSNLSANARITIEPIFALNESFVTGRDRWNNEQWRGTVNR